MGVRSAGVRARFPRAAVAVTAVITGLLLPAVLTPRALSANGSEDGSGQAGEVTLRVGIQQEFDSLNPFLGFSRAATEVFRLIYPTLTTHSSEDFSVVPELATDWEASRDKLTWTFHIREGVKWSDGEPVTAHDVAYTFNRMMTDSAAATANGNYVDNFAEVSAPDDGRVVIRTETPQATMRSLAVPIVPEHVWSRVDDVADFANREMPIVGSGPFEVTGYRPQQYLTLEADEDFWRGAPTIDRLRFVNFENSDAAVQALRKGEIDVARKLTPAQFDALKGAEDIERVKGKGRRFYELVLNPGAANSAGEPIGTGHPALRDVRVRRALDRAIDRSELVERVLGGHGTVGAGYLPPIFRKYHWSPPPGQRRPFSLEAANRALDEAGYPRGPDGTRRDPSGRPLNFEFVLHGDSSTDALVGKFVKEWLSEIGIEVSLQPVSDNQVNQRTTAGDFDMVISGWSVNPDPDYVLRLQTCGARPDPGGGGLPDSFLCDERYDELYARQLAEFDRDARVDLVKRAQRRFHEMATGLILFYPNALEAYRSDRFAGFEKQPADQGVITAQQGYWGYYRAEPTERARTAGGGDGYRSAAFVIVGVLLLGALAVVSVSAHRRRTAEHRE
ncbi:ABC transporter substrate-binding protein [Actinopolyspora saharensis]|uniref:Peptide/nickel transport system substrate-binding protein n=1 Tax=Actinopolyspora saharensis TaxID=995062 RepID=A0A1H0YC37_9ACTN|nr:ABC transporter substrate-binding protein [Actinopolyspora saharensis]SDQ12446.1 peptide/nickel transport system substrate-binding protein [Actinopolyspora saharensis]